MRTGFRPHGWRNPDDGPPGAPRPAGLPGEVRAAILARMDVSAWRIWLAIVLLVDAAIGLLGINTFARFLPARRITRLALAEAAAAALLVIWHFGRHG